MVPNIYALNQNGSKVEEKMGTRKEWSVTLHWYDKGECDIR